MAKVVRFSVAMLDCWRVYVDRSGVYFKVPQLILSVIIIPHFSCQSFPSPCLKPTSSTLFFFWKMLKGEFSWV